MLSRRIGLCTATLLGLIVLSPWIWGTGFLLHYDLVFVPHLPLSASTAGIDGGVPRAVPNDVVVALLDTVVPGWLVERVILLGYFVVIGWGVDRWNRPVVTRLAATVALCWNPWVGERLAIGHWGYLWGYAGLVWVVIGAVGLRGRENSPSSSRATFIVGCVIGSLSGSTGGVLIAIAAVILLMWPGATRPRATSAGFACVMWLALNSAWWFPFLLLAPSSAADGQGVSAFAAKADSPAGLWPSLASGGGIWHEASWFGSRSNGLIVVVVAVFAAGGVALFARSARAACGWSIPFLAVVGLLLAAAASIPGVQNVVVWVVLHLPGGGLLRDAQKFSALWCVPAALGVGLGVEAVRRRASGTLLAPCVVLASVVAPVASLPDLAWADSGRWIGSQYPKEFRAVAQEIGGKPGAVAIFPWQLYRQYAWNGNQVVLDPWQRLLPNRVIVNDDLPLNSGVVRGESPKAAEITAALKRDRNKDNGTQLVHVLKALGVRYLVEQKDQPAGQGRAPAVGHVVHDGPLLQVRDLGESEPSDAGSVSRSWWAAAGLVGTAAATMSALALLTRGRRRMTESARRC